MKILLFLIDAGWFLIRGDLRLRFRRILHGKRKFRDYLQRHNQYASRQVALLARRWFGVRLRVERRPERELPSPLLVLSNHQSLLDIPFIWLSLPRHDIRFVAKSELGKGIPQVSPILRYGRHALIKRAHGFSQTRRALLRVASSATASPVLFPEGTRSPDGRLGTFHAAGLRVLVGARPYPVLVIAVEGGTALRDVRALSRGGGRVIYRLRHLSVLPSPRGKEETARILDAARDEISRQLSCWRDQEGKTVARL